VEFDATYEIGPSEHGDYNTLKARIPTDDKLWQPGSNPEVSDAE
jgi:hypothetical protein